MKLTKKNLILVCCIILIPILPLTFSSCKNERKDVAIPMSFYEVSGDNVINGFTEKALNEPSLLNGYDTMEFPNGYSLSNFAFSAEDNLGKQSKLNGCFKKIKKMHLKNLNVGSHSFKCDDLSSLKGTAGPKGTALSLPNHIHDVFNGCDLSGITKMDLSEINIGNGAFEGDDLSGLKGTAGLNGTALKLSSVIGNAFDSAKLPGINRLNLSQISLADNTFWNTDLSGLKGTAGTGTIDDNDYALVIGETQSIKSTTFSYSFLNAITKLSFTNAVQLSSAIKGFKNANLSSVDSLSFYFSTSIPDNCFTKSNWYIRSGEVINIYLPTTTSNDEKTAWNTWAVNCIGDGLFVFNYTN